MILGCTVYPGEDARQLGGENAECERSLVAKMYRGEEKAEELLTKSTAETCFWCENWSWSRAILDRIRRSGDKSNEAFV